MAQLAALQSELQVVKAQHQKLRMRDFGKMLDEDDLEYDAEEAGAAAAIAAAPAAPAMPASFLMMPDKRSEQASWAVKGWIDSSVQAAPAAQPPQQPPGFVDRLIGAKQPRRVSPGLSTGQTSSGLHSHGKLPTSRARSSGMAAGNMMAGAVGELPISELQTGKT